MRLIVPKGVILLNMCKACMFDFFSVQLGLRYFVHYHSRMAVMMVCDFSFLLFVFIFEHFIKLHFSMENICSNSLSMCLCNHFIKVVFCRCRWCYGQGHVMFLALSKFACCFHVTTQFLLAIQTII